MMANLYGAPGPEVCLQDGDPLGGRTTGVTGGFTPAYNNLDKQQCADSRRSCSLERC